MFCVLPCGISLKMVHVHLKWNFASFRWNVLKISVKHSMPQYPCWLFFERSIHYSVVLKSSIRTVLLLISFLKSSKILLIYLGVPMLNVYMFTRVISSWWITSLSIMYCPSLSLYQTQDKWTSITETEIQRTFRRLPDGREIGERVKKVKGVRSTNW